MGAETKTIYPVKTKHLGLLQYKNIKILFIVLSLAAVLLLPINSIIEVKSFTYPPGLRNPALRGNRITSSISHSICQGIGHQI